MTAELCLYGIKNCDTVKKARRLLDDAGVAYRFHDFRSDGLTPEQLAQFVAAVGWETLLNRQGTTWRRLPEASKADLSAAHAVELMLAQPSLIKRPVIVRDAAVAVGLDAMRALLAVS